MHTLSHLQSPAELHTRIKYAFEDNGRLLLPICKHRMLVCFGTSSSAYRVAGPDQPAAMLPLIDMANHSFDNNCGARPHDDGGIEMYAKRDIKAGEALLMNYGEMQRGPMRACECLSTTAES